MIDKSTGLAFDGTIAEADITCSIIGKASTLDDAAFTNGVLDFDVLVAPEAPVSGDVLMVSISGDTFYAKEKQFTLTWA